MIIAHRDPSLAPRHSALKRRRATQYNPITSILVCPVCRRSYGVGLVLWSLSRGGTGREIPADHNPTRRELAQLGLYGAYSLWGREVKRQGDELNLAIDAECSCPRRRRGWDEHCPIHGWADYAGEDEPS